MWIFPGPVHEVSLTKISSRLLDERHYSLAPDRWQ